MQDRHTNRKRYFDELAVSSRKYFLPYLEEFFPITSSTRILEIGCGDGGESFALCRATVFCNRH